MTNEEQIQQKYMQFQVLQQQLEQLSQHLELLTQQNSELEISTSAVKKLGEAAEGNELLASVADGIFFKARLGDNKKLVVNVGSDITVEKTVPEVVELLERQKGEISKKMAEADALMQKLSSQAMEIYQEVEKLQE